MNNVAHSDSRMFSRPWGRGVITGSVIHVGKSYPGGRADKIPIVGLFFLPQSLGTLVFFSTNSGGHPSTPERWGITVTVKK